MTYPKPWMLPLIVVAIVAPTVAAVAVGGPGLGVTVGLLLALTLAVIAIRQRPGGPIETAPGSGGRHHVLIVLAHELDDPRAVEQIKEKAGLAEREGGGPAEVLVLAPARSSLLDRWATDVGAARAEASRKLEVTVSMLERAGLDAEGSIGDEDIVRAVEDALREFPAEEVYLVSGDGGEVDGAVERAAEELGRRLDQPCARVSISG